MRRRDLLVPVLSILCLLATGLAGARAADCVDLSGKWHGTWVSCKSGHHGTLNARFRKIGDDCYQVRFTGTFFVVVPFGFRANLAVTKREDGKVYLSTSKRLPVLGTFCMSAVATECEFNATYSSKDDEGQFNLHR